MKTVIESKVATPYAEALIQAAKSTNKVDVIIKDLVTIISLLKKHPVLRLYLEHPLVALEDKQMATKNIFTNFVDSLTVNFLLVLVEKNRINCVDAIIKKFTDSLSDSMKISIARVTSAVPLTTDQQSQLLVVLKEYCNASEVKLLCTVDPEILAGLKVQINSQLLDLSVEGQMRNLIKYFGLSVQLA
jgi:F-type H+-transporting ATPase subunit delta